MAAGPSLLAAAQHARNLLEAAWATQRQKLDAILMLKNAITLAILDPEDVDKAVNKPTPNKRKKTR